MLNLRLRDINNLAHMEGLDVIWGGSLTAPKGSSERLKVWQDSGYAAEMRWMTKPPEDFLNPAKLMPGAKSLLITTAHYSSEAPKLRPAGTGRVARYAWGRDYHTVLKARLGRLMKRVSREYDTEINFRVVSDAVPLLERAYAEEAGMGFIGKNSMLIRPGIGSYYFLAEIVTDIEIDSERTMLGQGSCGRCNNCRSECPTGAIVSDKVIDARRCISYLTIEKRSELNAWERRAIGEWIFGCDVCQEVCPFNHRAHVGVKTTASLPEFSSEEGCGPFLSLGEVLDIKSEEAFTARFAGTPLMRAKRVGLLRNAAVVAANTRSEELFTKLLSVFERDSSELVRQHALWAFCEINKVCNIASEKRLGIYVSKAMRDSSLLVRKEAEAIGSECY